MDNFINDLIDNLLNYYNDFILLIPKLALAIITFSILYFIANQTRRVVNSRLSKRMDDPLLARFLARIVKVSIVLFALMVVLKIVGLTDIATGMLTGASVSAIVVGFAFKDIGENFLAGIILAFNRPFRVGDTVELGGSKGKVVSLEMRSTHIKSFDGKDIYIPNANIIKNPLINFTIDGFLRQQFDIGLDYDSDIQKAIKITNEAMLTVDGVLKENKAPAIAIGALTPSTLNLTVYYWLDTFDTKHSSTSVRIEAIEKTFLALNEAGFYLPGDVVELKNYKATELKSETKAV